MKAIFFTEYGGPEVLHMKELEKPIPGGHEILVRVHAASVNSWDWDLLRGEPRLFRMIFGLFKPRINILGCDIAGTVMETGRKVTRFQPGDEVFGDISGGRWGGFAEVAIAREDELVRKPAGMTFEQAAAIPQAGVLALQALQDKRPIRPGDQVLINGAGGGVGTFAIQMAKYFGAEVTAVDSGEKLTLLKSVGADHVLNYTTVDYTVTGLQYDLIVDVIAQRSIFDYKKALKRGGAFVMVGGSVSRILQVMFLGYLVYRTSGKRLGILAHQPNKDLEYLIDLFKDGKLKPVIDRTFRLPQVPEALQYLGDGQVHGKVVVTISQDE